MKERNRSREKRKPSPLKRKIVVEGRLYTYTISDSFIRIRDDEGQTRLYNFVQVFSHHYGGRISWNEVERAKWKRSNACNVTPDIVRQTILNPKVPYNVGGDGRENASPKPRRGKASRLRNVRSGSAPVRRRSRRNPYYLRPNVRGQASDVLPSAVSQ